MAPYPLSMVFGHPDKRYNFVSLGTKIPAQRASIRHTRETNPNPLFPRTFILPNRSRDPIAFIRCTEQQPFGWYQPPLSDRDQCSFELPDFYFEPLSASRDRKKPIVVFSGYTNDTIPVSCHPIFTLSEVVVQRVLFYLDDADLAALSLVDKDCLQLVRALRFRSVWINYSSASMALLDKLVDEGSDRVSHKFTSGQPMWTLGACIRRISIQSESASKGEQIKPTSWVDTKRQDYDAVAYHQRHMNLLELALRVALPNLEFLDWRDHVPLLPIMADAMAHSTITRLELNGVTLRQDFDLLGTTERERRMVNLREWPLRRLVLNVTNLLTHDFCAPLFTASILRLVAMYLQELVWEGNLSAYHQPTESHTLGTDKVVFKNLQKLQMTRVPLADDTVLSALVPGVGKPMLKDLFIDSPDPKLAPFFASRGHIASLKHLNWADIAPYNDIDPFVSFVNANPQLETFRTEDTTPKLLDNRLVPLFSSSFHTLTSLAFVFDTPVIAPKSLELIGTMTSLKRLWLSAGIEWTKTHDWFVDHESLRENLAPLSQLQLFALTDDLYPNGNKRVPGFSPPKSQKWENGHGRLMARHAMEFAKSHPVLEWIYFGEVPMTIERAEDGSGEVVDAVPLVEKRKDCEWLLKHIWGRDRPDWVYST